MNYFDYAVIIATAIAALLDLKTRKIPNWLTFTMAAAGLAGSLLVSGWSGLLSSLAGCLVGLLIFIIPFILGGFGGGDVKLMGAIGAFVGAKGVLAVAVLAALWGGLMALAAIAWKKIQAKNIAGLKTSLFLFLVTKGKSAASKLFVKAENIEEKNRTYLPYGVAILLGLITYYLTDFSSIVPW